MRLAFRGLVVICVLALGASAAQARVGGTTTDLALRAAPSPRAELMLTIPAGAKVDIGACAQGWCKVAWQGYAGYVRARGLAVQTRRRVARAPDNVVGDEIWPIYPPYPYRAGHYPKADWYHGMPPYVAISPSFYRKRFFMMAQERNRYRYMPHIFRGGYSYDDNGELIGDIDTRRISDSLRETYNE